MVFSSIPVYLDPPNWQQQQPQQEPNQLPPLGDGGMTGSSNIRPGSMTERARLAKLPQPEIQLKCPRCESTNTKFCYFNNYSLSQPRHFCKTCRRYWTRGGALRNVPVGGGCQRNKRGKGRSRSKSPAATTTSSTTSGVSTNSNLLGHMPPPPQPRLPFYPSLHTLTHEYGAGEIGLGFGEIQEQWRLQQVQQLPLLAGNGMYHQFEDEQGVSADYVAEQFGSKALDSGANQFAGVKMEENLNSVLNLPRTFLGVNNPGNTDHQYWSGTGNAWNDLSGFNHSSSTTHPL
ncbi:hypothetical protein RJ640_009310 [Escallonia rubra]|uniref:Dof zinc finger protein n=1 Tax=Escallonia rubra TaxID=112253 RepID=A0AA88UA31_9ASTE|nr:hypothetical protein RJ640_009310 [Escallonia rubra]